MGMVLFMIVKVKQESWNCRYWCIRKTINNMIRLTKIYAKLIDKLTIEEAPEELSGVVGFKYDAKKCIEAGYFPVKFTAKSGNTATYQLLNGEITQIWIDIDSDLYSLRVVELIRDKYSENEELAILREDSIRYI